MYLYFSFYLLNQAPSTPEGRGRHGVPAEGALSFHLVLFVSACQSQYFPPLLPSLYKPSRDLASLHIQQDESPKGRGPNIVAEPSPPPVKLVVWQLARDCLIRPPAYESGGRVVLSVWLTK